jgi:citrate synthase
MASGQLATVNQEHEFEFCSIPYITILIEWSFEKASFTLCYQTIPSENELIHFNEKGKRVRALAAEAFTVKQSLFSAPIIVLQSLAASITVYQNEWEYINQLLMTFSSFYYDKLIPMDNFESQLFLLLTQQRYDYAQLEKFNTLLNIWIDRGLTTPTNIALMTAKSGADFGSIVSSAIGSISGQREGKVIEKSLNNLLSLTVSQVDSFIQQSKVRNEIIDGFTNQKQSAFDLYMIEFTRKVAEIIADQDPQYQQFFGMAEFFVAEISKKRGLEPTIEFYTGLCLHFLQIPQHLFCIFISFSQILGWQAHIAKNQEIHFGD